MKYGTFRIHDDRGRHDNSINAYWAADGPGNACIPEFYKRKAHARALDHIRHYFYLGGD
ncbi:hypothetical protein SOASR030_30480 [Leminorella grimontii]|uniref:Uncharacterized protein n=1 Tax=Leminorella grimontii TaxID=82981 RepID=A0AAV5N495_9GAMM|nr:hypothetical protein SOASR030_30480 [Leminorella grimontii]